MEQTHGQNAHSSNGLINIIWYRDRTEILEYYLEIKCTNPLSGSITLTIHEQFKSPVAFTTTALISQLKKAGIEFENTTVRGDIFKM